MQEKLGTRQLPTAELELQGARGLLVSAPGRGVPAITSLVNVTRVHNAVAAAAAMRRCVALCRDYAHRRVAFGAPLASNPLHLETLARLDVAARGATLLVFDVVARMGRVEAGRGGADDEPLLRILTPLAKLATGKAAIAVASETVEMFGGVGYCEDSGVPVIFRDAQTLPVWEGTTNVLSHDVHRVMLQTKGDAMVRLIAAVEARCAAAAAAAGAAALAPAVAATRAGAGALASFASAAYRGDPNAPAVHAVLRDFALSAARVYTAGCLLEHAAARWAGAADAAAAVRWACEDEGGGLVCGTLRGWRHGAPHDRSAATAALALDHDAAGAPRGCGDGPGRWQYYGPAARC